MLKIIRQNQNIILVSVGLFIISLTALLFLVNNSEKRLDGELKTDIVSASESGSEKTEESTYRKLINNEEDPIIVLRVDGSIEYASPELKLSEGYSPEKLKNKLFYSLLNPDDLSVFLGAYGKALASEEAVTMIGPYRMRSASGEYSINMGSLYPVKNGEKVQKIILTTRNISKELNSSGALADPLPPDEEMAAEDAGESVKNEEPKPSAASTDDSLMLKADVFESSADDPVMAEKDADPVKTLTKDKYTKPKTSKDHSSGEKKIEKKLNKSNVEFGDVFNTAKEPKEYKEPKAHENLDDFNYKNSKIFKHKLTYIQ